MTTYKFITKHGHPNASVNGQIYAHVFIMSEMLGRALTDLEVVHHIDEDKGNNSPGNLQLFANQAEHLTHHMHLRALHECGNPNYRKCPYCKQYDNPEDMSQRNDEHANYYYHTACVDLYNVSMRGDTRRTPEGRAKANAANVKSKAKKRAALLALKEANGNI